MKGIILAGGSGSRLHLFTKIINKHLFPVYDKPMINYPIHLLIESGIREIAIVVSNALQATQISKMTDGGKTARFEYVIQEAPLGTAHALSLCKDFTNEQPFMVAWGDNVVEYNLSEVVKYHHDGTRIFIKKVDDLASYGEVVLNENGNVQQINCASNSSVKKQGYALAGIFIFAQTIFKYISCIQPNSIGELDIVDALNIATQELWVEELQGYWIDAASSFDNLLKASSLVKEKKANKYQY